MSKIEYGGSAFPCEGGIDSGLHPDPGMSLRDWFAGQALTGQLAAMNPGFFDKPSAQQLALSAYWIADAMLAQRSDRSEP